MKSSMGAALSGLAVLGQAQQQVSHKPSEDHTVATIAIADDKPSTTPITTGVPITVVSQDAATVTTAHCQQQSSARPTATLAAWCTQAAGASWHCVQAVGASASGSPLVCTPAAGIPAPTTTLVPSPPVQPQICPDGQYPCPQPGNGTTAPPASVTTSEAGYVQTMAGVAMVVAGVFGLLMV